MKKLFSTLLIVSMLVGGIIVAGPTGLGSNYSKGDLIKPTDLPYEI